MNIPLWLRQSAVRATPYGISLIVYVVVAGLFGGALAMKSLPTFMSLPLSCILFGSSVAAIYAAWKFSLAFSPEPQYRDEKLGYLEVEDAIDTRSLSEQLLTYRLHLRKVALSYEKQRQNLTRIALITALLLVSVPIYTWADILTRFADITALPNAWLLVFSSGSTGAIGLAIAVTIFRHIKNNQRPLTEIQERMFDALEAGMAINASDVSNELKARALANVLNGLSALRGRRGEEIKDESEPSDKDVVMSVFADAIKSAAKHP